MCCVGLYFPDNLEELSQYVTASISPSALQEELGRCVVALGVSQETLQQQQEDLEKASRKLSAFLSAVHSLMPES